MIRTERLGLNVPYEWWASAPLLKEFEAAGFRWVQVSSPPVSVLDDTRSAIQHAKALASNLDTSSLRCVIHAPALLAGTREGDRAFEGVLSYAAEAGAHVVVYHARALPDEPASEDAFLHETRSLARHSMLAERLGILIAIENLAPVFPGPLPASANPLALRGLVGRIGSGHLGICLDVGHANVVAELLHTDLGALLEPVLDAVALFHVHDNLGARKRASERPEIDPIRWDLHLPPGRGNIEWAAIAPLVMGHDAPVVLEVHPPHRPPAAELAEIGGSLGVRRVVELAE